MHAATLLTADAPISAAELIARFRDTHAAGATFVAGRAPAANGEPLTRTGTGIGRARVEPSVVRAAIKPISITPTPAPVAAPVLVPARPSARTTPDTWISAAELIARHGALADGPPSRSGGHHRSGRSRADVAMLVPALRPRPTIRLAVRPVLTATAIIAAVGLVEAPTLLASTHTAASAGPTSARTSPAQRQSATTGSAPSTSPAPNGALAADAAGTDAGARDNPNPGGPAIGGPAPVGTTGTTVQRVSRSTRRALAAPAKAAGAAHVPAMKPGQTVPGTWILPNGGPMTSCFCARWGSFHAGIDLAGKLGSPILAVGDGTVVAAGPASGFGNWVVIQHSNGDVSIYGHMQYFFVHKGQQVKAGEKIALVGDEGFSTGPHLHFEVHKGGLSGPKINPVPWLRARGIIVGPLDKNG